MKRRSVALTATAGATAGLLGLTALTLPAGAADPDLPAIQPEKLVSSVMTARSPEMAGTIRVNNDLGLPALPGVPESSPISGGSSTLRVWSDGQGRHRLAVPSEGGEKTVVDDGDTTWKWSSAERTVTKYRSEATREHRPATTPAETARNLIAKLRESSEVAVDGTADVAGRDTYELVLTPEPTERTVLREVRIAVDAEKRIPLRVVVETDGAREPALTAGFTKLALEPQDPELFRFSPPDGAKVTTPEAPERTERARHRVIGAGWDGVLLTRLPREPQSRQGTDEGSRNPRDLARRIGEPVSGDWGRGWIVTTRSGSALLTADGRLVVGAVPEQVLTGALGAPR